MAMWKEEKKKRNARGSVLRGQGYEILGIGFVLLLLGFGILNLASPDREFSETENRMLEQRPDVQLSSVADGRFMKSFETWQTDQFVFRDGWIRLRTAADRMLGKKESGGVFLGEDDCEAIKGKRILIVDDVISTGESLHALEELVQTAGGIVTGRAAILAEGDALKRDDIIYLNPLPVFNADGTVKE